MSDKPEDNMDRLASILHTMQYSPVRNYATPGLTSWLVGGANKGKVRLFHSTVNTQEWITPHSHRFDFTCLVLAGNVTNILFAQSNSFASSVDCYAEGTLSSPVGGLGAYHFSPGETGECYYSYSKTYHPGDTYTMRFSEIHSIRFSRGAEVLF